MPKPPLLPFLDWKSVVEGGKEFETWVAESPETESAQRIRDRVSSIPLTPQEEGFLKALPKTVHVVAIAEAWCGDVVRHVPALERIASAGSRVRTRYIRRDDHPDLFARFLTNGGEAIPKFVFLSEAFTECGTWGPMPAECREWISRGKACGDIGAARKRVGALYDADPDLRVDIRELLALVDIAATATI